MKKPGITKMLLRIPNRDTFMIAYQYGKSGFIMNDTNNGKGYTEEEAINQLK
jgi:hypothetical protein